MSPKVYNSYGQEVGWIDLLKCKVYHVDGSDAGWIDVFKCKCQDENGEWTGRVDAFQGNVDNLRTFSKAGRVDISTFSVFNKYEEQVVELLLI